jgi:Bacterial Ig domain
VVFNVLTTGLSRRAVSALFVAVLCVQYIAPHQAAGATWHVQQGDDLQQILSRAEPGDEIVLQAGARFVGTFWLPSKALGPTITIRSGAPLPERRLTPADASLLPTIASGSPLPALDGTGASNWKLVGIRFESTTTGEGEVIVLQDANNITLDRLLIVAGDNGQKRAIRGNGRHIVLSRSHIANIWRVGQDSQTFCAWDGAGPYTITDNYLEAASENVMFGGADSASPERVPADILVVGNHLRKPPEWRGMNKGVKNLLELKQAKRAVIRNNLMESVWPEAQTGYAILVTVRNDEGNSPWAVVEDVLFEANIVRDAHAGVSVLGYDLGSPSGQTTRVTFRDNAFILSGPFLLIGGEVGVVTFDHNTVRQGGSFLNLYTGEVWPSGAAGPRAAEVAAESLTITNTMGNHNEHGVYGDGVGHGALALTALTRSSLWTHNVLAGEAGWGHVYPQVTWQPSMTEYASQVHADLTLSPTSMYRNAGTDGLDLGVRNLPPSPAVEQHSIAPTVTLTSPSAGAVYPAPATITLSADAVDPGGEIARVEFFAGSELVATERVAPYTLDWSGVQAGTYALTAVAYGVSGASTRSAPVTVTVTVSGEEHRRPIVTLTSPSAGAAYLAPATISLSADAVDPDGEIARVEFFAGSELVATERVAPYALNWTDVQAGMYALTAVAYDVSGASTRSAPVTVTVTVSGEQNRRPIVALTSPSAGAAYPAPATITLSADAVDPDGEIARVEFFAGGELVATERVAPYLLNWSGVQAGTYALTAVAYDLSGASASSGPVTVTVSGSDVPAPRAVAFTVSADHANVSSYVLKIFGADVHSRTGTPVATSDLGKPAPDANNDVMVNRLAFFESLAPGNYVATVTAISAGGEAPSAAVAFAR